MKRILLGIIALTLTMGGFALWFGEAAAFQQAAPILIRAGFLLGTIWLAMPQVTELLTRYPPWLVASFTLLLLVLIVRPRLCLIALPYLLPLVLALVALQVIGRILKPPTPRQKR